MNPFGTFTPSQFSASNPKNMDVGIPWGYIRVINNSAYALKISLGGQGSVEFPEGFLEDIPVDRSFNGKIVFTPVQNYAGTAVARALANYVTVNAFRPGELAHPQAQPIGTLNTTANISQDYQTAFVNNPGLDISAAGHTASQTLSATFPNIGQVSASSPGYLLLGYLQSSNARELIVPMRNGYREGVSATFSPVTVANGGGSQNFQLPNATAITSFQLTNWSVNNAGFTVNAINLDRNDGVFQAVSLLAVIPSSANAFQSLTQQYGPYGFEGYGQGSGGLRLQLVFANSTGSTQTVSLIVFGSRFAFDDARLVVTFTDWATPANTYTLAVVRLSEVDKIPLNFLVPTPVTNSAMANFGTLTYQVLNTTEYYAAKYFSNIYTIDTVIPANLIIPGSGT